MFVHFSKIKVKKLLFFFQKVNTVPKKQKQKKQKNKTKKKQKNTHTQENLAYLFPKFHDHINSTFPLG